MKSGSVEYKTTEIMQGDARLPAHLSEYLSRTARCKLSNNIYYALQEEIRIEKNFLRRNRNPIPRTLNASRVMAQLLGVDPSTVYRWRTKGFQSCNVNAEKLIQCAVKYCPENACTVLEEDLENHRFLLSYLIPEIMQGDARLLPLLTVGGEDPLESGV